VSFSQAEAFVRLKQDWIRKNQTKLRGWELNHLKSSPSVNHLSDGQARSLLIQRVEKLARLYGYSYNRIYIRRQRTRWGSCSAKNNISLNIRLAGLPDMLRDYVILHELLHTRIKGHGKVFWQELNKHVGDARGIRKRLNRIPLC
jgi:predicted metal-dependent hydrolase